MAGLKTEIQEKCNGLDIPLVGVASAASWTVPPFRPWVPEEFHPRSIYPEANSVIVIGFPVDLPILETTPSIYYHELYATVNSLLDQSAYRLSLFLNRKGYPSLYLPRDGYGSLDVLRSNPFAFFSHRHAAFLAGLGTFGVNNTLLTKEYGPRVRFTSIFTAAHLSPDPLMKEDLCVRCMRCVRACPARALEERNYPEGLTDKERCTRYNQELGERFVSPCGMCIKVCPVGSDREHFQRTDPSLYLDADEHREHHNAWRHVRSYGGR